LVNHPFHTFDDPGYVTDNDYVLDGITTEGLVWAFTNLDMANWHPLTWVSHMVDVELFGNKPAGHYFTNIVAHIIASVLLFRFVHKLSGSELMGFWTAIIWAVHPTNVECVAWIAERKTILSLLFMFAGGLFYLQYRAGGSRMAYLICVVFGLCSSMAKPIAVLFPVMLVLVDCLKDARVDSMNESRNSVRFNSRWRFRCNNNRTT
jgi:hypothetical protein